MACQHASTQSDSIVKNGEPVYSRKTETNVAGLGVEVAVSKRSISFLEQTFRVCLDEVELGLRAHQHGRIPNAAKKSP